jgi:hypothetical protein
MKHIGKLSIFFLGLAALIAGCGPKVYKGKPGFETTIVRGHELLAVLPFKISVDNKSSDQINTESQDLSNKALGYTAQKNTYISFLDQFGKKKYNVEFQDAAQTNELLRKSHIQYDELESHDKSELCILLGVDAIVWGDIHSANPLLDESETTASNSRKKIPNKTKASIQIYGQRDGQQVWSYNYETPSVVGNNIQSVIRALMTDISSQFPYKKK